MKTAEEWGRLIDDDANHTGPRLTPESINAFGEDIGVDAWAKAIREEIAEWVEDRANDESDRALRIESGPTAYGITELPPWEQPKRNAALLRFVAKTIRELP